MKFSCPSCAAKYQIADEKVAGRTVKMKCRKCGTVIPIRAQPSKKSMAAAPVVRAQSLRPSPGAAQLAPAPKGLRALGVSNKPGVSGETEGPPSVPTQPPPAEWHAGIGGTAVGPMSFHEMETKIREGSVTAETFIWKDGMDGWKPAPEVKDFAALVASVELQGPPSMPAVAKAQVPAPAAVELIPARRAASRIPKPAPAPAPAPASKSLSASESDVEPASAPKSAAEHITASNPVISDLRVGAAPNAAASDVKTEDASSVDEQSSSSTDAPIPDIALPSAMHDSEHPHHSYDSLVMQLQKKRSNPLVIPFAVLTALILGLTVGFVLFGDQQTKIIRQVVEVPAKIGEAKEHKRELVENLAKPTVVAATEVKEAKKAQPSPSGKTASSAGTSPANPSGSQVKEGGLKGLSGLQGLGGPSSGPSSKTAAASNAGQLEAGQIQRTVSKYQTSVKRGCWQPALSTRDKNAASSARVSVSITVAPSGSVTRAASSGDPKGYSGLSSCITRKVRGWQFPRSSGTTTVNVPFVFAAQ